MSPLRRKAACHSGVAAALFLCCLTLLSAGTGPSSFLHGIDVSRYQKEVNWEHVKNSNVHFAFIKATEGDFYKDPSFDRNWEQSRQNGIKRGAYHFYIPYSSVEKQLEMFKNTVTLQPGDLAPVLDVEKSTHEVSDTQLRSDIRKWLVGIEEHYGVKPIIYTYQAYYNKKLKGYFPEYHFWIARYQSSEPFVHSSDKMAFWQYSETGVVKGIEVPVDMNWFYGDEEALNKLCVPKLPSDPEKVIAQN